MCEMPHEGTSPCVAFIVTTPQNAAGIRPLPPWSTPSDMSTSPERTAAPEPPDEPPAERVGSTGLRAGPNALVSPSPDEPKSSMFSFPTIAPPAARMRSTTTASYTGT